MTARKQAKNMYFSSSLILKLTLNGLDLAPLLEKIASSLPRLKTVLLQLEKPSPAAVN